jgi:PAS domain S-box-containing protein
MSIIITLLSEQPFLILPTGFLGWIGVVAWLVGIGFLLRTLWHYQKSWTLFNRVLILILLLLVPVTTFFVGARLPVWNAFPLPEVALVPKGLSLMFFSAVPWVLGSALLGPLPAAILAAISGTILAVWDTHSLFTVFETTFLALTLSWFLGQRYRSWIFKRLRQPIIAIFLLSLIYPLIYSVNSVFFTRGSITGQIDYAFSNVTAAMLVYIGPLLVSGLISEIVKYVLPDKWGGQPPWQLSPYESSLEARFLRSFIPLALIFMLALMVGDWIIAGNAARKILQDRMASTAQIVAEEVPHFLDIGQNLLLRLADKPEFYKEQQIDLGNFLQEDIRTVPFFRQVFVLDQDANSIGGYPIDDFYTVATTPEEEAGIKLALSGVRIQTYTLPALDGTTPSIISFIASIENPNGDVEGVVIGRTDIESNPFSKPILTSLESLESIGGTGFLLDEEGNILYHPDPNRLLLAYTPQENREAEFYDETGPDGTRQITYFKPAVGRPSAVVLMLPAQRFQQLAINIAAPLLGMVIILSIVAIGLIRMGLGNVTASLKSLAVETERISQGQLDHALDSVGGDEVGQLRRAFEKMRISLKERLDELNRLLMVSQGVASSLEMDNAVQPILESALATGASSARIVLVPAVIPPVTTSKPKMPSRFGLGNLTETYAKYDDQLLRLMVDQPRIVLTNPSRTTLLSFHPGIPRPESLLSIALQHENQYYGTLWVAYDSPHIFTNEEVRFLTTLAGQAALSAANRKLFWTAEFGRQRLEAILASTPDPVIVTDHQDQLLLVNPVARQVFALGEDYQNIEILEDVIPQPKLLKILRSEREETESIEVSLPNGRIYLATASSIMSDGKRIGRVCVLRDITDFKELDALKSEFVATVSHDLRSPLTLVRGYATMLSMVGDLNNQQENYIKKIVAGVEGMSRLINNLLDLGRIEAKIGLQLEKLHIQDILDEVVGAYRLQATQKQIKLHVPVPQLSTPIIEADRAMLQQAFHNLLDNAIKYTPDGKEIWIRLKEQKNSLVFEFQDSGIGISTVDIPRLFEKFYRSANREAKKQSGTGLGLAIVKSIAERHGGRVWVKSQLGRGTIFYFEIPMRQTES